MHLSGGWGGKPPSAEVASVVSDLGQAPIRSSAFPVASLPWFYHGYALGGLSDPPRA